METHHNPEWTDARLLACLSGQASDAEQRDCQVWRAAHPDHEARYQALALLWEQAAEPVWNTPIDTDAAWDSVEARIKPAARLVQIDWSPGRWALAASVLLALTLAWGFYRWQSPQMLELTAQNQELETRLPDGTQVRLAAGSQLAFTEKDGQRRIKLQGKAYFQVAKDAAHPFVIQGEAVNTTVLGTRFDLVAQPGQEAIAVEEGRVSFRHTSSGQELILTAGEAASLNPQGLLVAQTHTNAATAWRSGQLVFEEASLAEVCADLGQQYGHPFDIRQPELAQRHFTGTLPATLSEAQVLEILADVMHLRSSRAGDTTLLEAR